MTKAELIDAVARDLGITKTATTEFAETLLAQIAVAVMKSGRFSFPGFGVWRLRTRKARNVSNPQTNEPMRIRASRTISFRPSKALKDEL